MSKDLLLLCLDFYSRPRRYWVSRCEIDFSPVSLPRSGSNQRNGWRREEAGRRPHRPVSTGYGRTLRPNGGSNDIFGRHGRPGRGWGSSRTSYSRTAAGQPQGSAKVKPTEVILNYREDHKVKKNTKYVRQSLASRHQGVLGSSIWCMHTCCYWKYWCRAPPSGLIRHSLLPPEPEAAHAGGDDPGSIWRLQWHHHPHQTASCGCNCSPRCPQQGGGK